MNLPPFPPNLQAALRDGLTGLLQDTGARALTSYRAGAGGRTDRVAAVAWLRPMLGDIDPNRVIVCAGAQCALTAILTLLTRPGDRVLVEPLVYPGFRAAAAQLGVRLQDVPSEGDIPVRSAPGPAIGGGMAPEGLAAALREHEAKAVYLVPTINNPTTVTMTQAQRRAVAAVAAEHGVPVIEDDAYGLFPSAPPMAVTACEAASGYYISTLAKCLAPGLRLAFVVAPTPPDATRLSSAIRATSLAPSPLLTALLTRCLMDGTALELLNAIRTEAAARQAMARAILPAGQFAADPHGLHVWLNLPPSWNRLDFCAHVRQRGLALVPADAFAVGHALPNAVRLALGAAERRDVLEAALHAVAAAMQGDPPVLGGDVI
jgi:DNA-binding transcriptional MocR family regulator